MASIEQAPDPTPVPQMTREEVRAVVIAWSIPVLPLLTFTSEWAVAWATLGHIPRPMIDDPNYISVFSSVLHTFTTMSFVLTIPAAFIAGLFYVLTWRPKRRGVLVAGICWGMTIGAFMALDKFPYRALGWWAD